MDRQKVKPDVDLAPTYRPPRVISVKPGGLPNYPGSTSIFLVLGPGLHLPLVPASILQKVPALVSQSSIAFPNPVPLRRLPS